MRLTLRFPLNRWDSQLAQPFGSEPGREVPDDHSRPIHCPRHDTARLYDAERFALAGFLAGYRGLTREVYALDLGQMPHLYGCSTRRCSATASMRSRVYSKGTFSPRAHAWYRSA
jgi:hypothetical protein